jgi:hypothetical protein
MKLSHSNFSDSPAGATNPAFLDSSMNYDDSSLNLAISAL